MIEKQCTKYLEKGKKTTKKAKHYHFSVLNARHSLLKSDKGSQRSKNRSKNNIQV